MGGDVGVYALPPEASTPELVRNVPLEKLMGKKEELAMPPPPPPAATQSPNASKEVLDLLEWQNGQIRDLQAKLGQLMAAGRRDSAAATEDGSLGRPHSQSEASLPQRLASPEGLQPSVRYAYQFMLAQRAIR